MAGGADGQHVVIPMLQITIAMMGYGAISSAPPGQRVPRRWRARKVLDCSMASPRRCPQQDEVDEDDGHDGRYKRPVNSICPGQPGSIMLPPCC